MDDDSLKTEEEQVEIEELHTEELKKEELESTLNVKFDEDFNQIYSIVKKINAQYTNTSTKAKLKSLRELAKTINTTYKNETYKIDERYAVLNREEFSIFRNGLITIGGECSSGKTSMLTDIATSILQNNLFSCFLFYSLDDCAELSARRIFSQLNNKNLMKSEVEAQDIELHENLLDKIHISTDFNVENLEIEAETLLSKANCSKIIVGIDYLQLVQTNNEKAETRNLLNNLLKQLKTAAINLNKNADCMLICLSQLNRERLSAKQFNFRESSEIENVSDVCLKVNLVYKNEYKKEIDFNSSERSVIVLKNKVGVRGAEFETTLQNTMRFTQLIQKFDERYDF